MGNDQYDSKFTRFFFFSPLSLSFNFDLRATDILERSSKYRQQDLQERPCAHPRTEECGPCEIDSVYRRRISFSVSPPLSFFPWFFPEGSTVMKLHQQVIVGVKASIISKRKCISLARSGMVGSPEV